MGRNAGGTADLAAAIGAGVETEVPVTEAPVTGGVGRDARGGVDGVGRGAGVPALGALLGRAGVPAAGRGAGVPAAGRGAGVPAAGRGVCGVSFFGETPVAGGTLLRVAAFGGTETGAGGGRVRGGGRGGASAGLPLEAISSSSSSIESSPVISSASFTLDVGGVFPGGFATTILPLPVTD